MKIIDARTKNGCSQEVIVLHISDLHLKTDSVLDKESRDYVMTYFMGQLRKVERRLAGPQKPFDIIAVTGDLADYEKPDERAHERVLLNARNVLEDLANEFCSLGADGLLIIPGNHDYRWTGNINRPSAQIVFAEVFRSYFRHKLFRFNSFDLLAACIDSNRGKGSDWARGQVDIPDLENLEGEIFALKRQLEEIDPLKKLLKFSLVHHHPFPVPAADRTIPTTIEKWLFRKVIVSGAEYMLLRNAGVFANKLIAQGYRLVLHGHLHKNGYWRIITKTDDQREAWLEVISGASLLKGERLSFNTARFFPSGLMEVTNYGWDPEGNPAEATVLPSAPYEVIRTLPSDAGKTEACSDLFSQYWTVNLGKGDWESVEILRGYRAAGKPVAEIKILTSSAGLTSTDFSIEKLGSHGKPDHHVGVSRISPDPAKPDTLNYFVEFNPPLQTSSSLDFVCRYVYRGVMNRSMEDLRCLSQEPGEGWDWIFQEVSRPTEQMTIRLQFEPDAAAASPWVPNEVHFEVRDERGDPSNEERQNCHIIYDRITIDEARKCGFPSRPQALLTVHRPRIGYTYILKWKLQDRDVIPNELELRRHQRKLANVGATAESRRKAEEFLRKMLPPLAHHLGGAWEDVAIFLFAYQEASHELVCVATTGSLDDPLYKSFKYGQDVVGTAFRRREAVSFVRSDKSFQYFRRLRDDGLAFLIGCPINFPDEKGWPVGVVAFASRDRNSRLNECCRDNALLLSLPRVISSEFLLNIPY